MTKYNTRQKYGMGWFNESQRHSLARQGIKTGRKVNYMYDLETIKQMNRERAKEAIGKNPLIYSGVPEDLRDIPNFGDYRPKNWKLVETYFVDSSGLGKPGEFALTFDEFSQKAKKGKGYAIIEEGQFQVYIGEFKKTTDYSKLDDKIRAKVLREKSEPYSLPMEFRPVKVIDAEVARRKRYILGRKAQLKQLGYKRRYDG